MSTSGTVDQRSIGELLLDADYQARQLLLDVDGADAAAMLRTWGEVVQAAGDLWSSLPSTPDVSPFDGATMQRLETMSHAQHRAQLVRDWPGDGPPDERLLGIAQILQRAAELADGPGRRVRPRTPAAYDDLDAARMRVMHTLYVGAHAVGVAVHQHVDDVRKTVGRHASDRETRDIPRGQEAAIRIAAFEQLAGGFVGNRFSQAMAGQHYTPPSGSGRLHQALVSWDIQAHRTLAFAPGAPNLHLAACTQAMIATASTAILVAASTTGRVSVEDYKHRLAPALDANQQVWARAANRWGRLRSRGERADPALVHAASEVRAAVHEIAFDRTHWTAPEVLAGRIDLAQATVTVQQAMIAAAELAVVHRDIAEQEPDLTGSARTIAAWSREAGIDDDTALISPGDVYANRAIKLPDLIRETLVANAEQLIDVSEATMSVAGALADVARRESGPAPGRPQCRSEERDPVRIPAPGRPPTASR
ncbi:hypothetical protein [Flexivirga sp.]|uniref:hypothetical protein n=1 Tax=Flexivirga sp. TaxID=1962927 RepID=UPI003F7D4E80